MGKAGGAIAGSLGGIAGGLIGSRSARSASRKQRRGLSNAIRTQQEMFERTQKLLKPFVDRGVEALGGQADLLGLSGPGEQAAALEQIQTSPLFQNLVAQGEEAILANASATGGLRGGNTQAALARFRPQFLNQQVQQRLANLQDLTTLGSNAAARTGTFGSNAASNIAQNQIAIGNVRAQGRMAQGQHMSNIANDLFNLGGTLSSFGGAGGGGFNPVYSNSAGLSIMD